MTDQTQDAATDEVVDFNPERCPVEYRQKRCTARADEIHDHHRWDSAEQERWVDETRRMLLEATDDIPLGLKPGTAYRVRVNGGEATTLRTTDADA